MHFEGAQYAKSTEAGQKALKILGQDSQEPLADRIRLRLVKTLVLANKYEEAQNVLSKVAAEASRKALEPSLSRVSALPNSKPEHRVIRKQLIDQIAYYRSSL